MPKKNPTLIFGETHDDPVVSRILTKLLFKLKELGYTHHFDETLTNSVEEEIANVNFSEDIYQKVKLFFENNNLDITSATDWEKFDEAKLYENKKLLENLGATEEQFRMNEQMIYLYTAWREARQTYKLLLENIANAKIIYQGIDSEARDVGLGELDLEEALQLTEEMRDKEIASRYISSKENVFGHGGIQHLPGIQNEILKKMSLQDAKEKFIFIYIASSPEEAFLYNAKKMHPVGLHYFDASKLSDEEIMQQILDLIPKQALNKKHHTLPHLSVFSSSMQKLKDKLSKHHQAKNNHIAQEQIVPRPH